MQWRKTINEPLSLDTPSHRVAKRLNVQQCRRLTTLPLLLIYLLSYTTGLCSSTSVQGSDLIISGKLRYKAYKPSEDLLGKSEVAFICRVTIHNLTNWSVRLENSNDERISLAPFEYHEVGTDGTDLFYIEKLKTAVLDDMVSTNRIRKALGGRTPSFISLTARIRSGLVPASEPKFFVAPIWFAFASADYLNRNETNEYLQPIWPTPDLSDGASYHLKSDVERHILSPNLPTRVVFFSPGKFPMQKPDESLVDFNSYLKPYDKGFTNAIFEAANFTNVLGLSIPLNFTLRQFRPRIHGVSANEVSLAAYWEGVVASIVESRSVLDYRPQILGDKVVVLDHRVHTVDGNRLQYVLTTKAWPSISEDHIKTALQSRNWLIGKQANLKPQRTSHSIKLLVRWTLILAVLISAFVCWRIARAKKHET